MTMEFVDAYGKTISRALDTPIYWRPTVRGLVTHEGKILLVQSRFQMKWELPGGAMEVGETPHQAVAREVLEETGYEIRVVQELPLAVESGFFYDSGKYFQALQMVFLAHLATVSRNENFSEKGLEIERIEWVSSHDANRLSFYKKFKQNRVP